MGPPVGYATFEGIKYNLEVDEERKTYQRLYHRKWYAEHKDKAKKYLNNWYKSHREEFREMQRKCRANRSVEQIEKEKLAARTRAWVKYNFDDEFREQKRKANRESYQNNEEVRKARQARYKERYANDEEFRNKSLAYSKKWNIDKEGLARFFWY
jgi:type I site-specific restriction endonuclease